MMMGMESQHISKKSDDTVWALLSSFGSQVALKDESDAVVKYSSILDLCNTKSFNKTRRSLTFCLIDNDLGGGLVI